MYKDLRIAVFGDFMLDQWLEPEDIGICPGQAAIDFKNPKRVMQKPGGAGNQAMNVALLGAKCTAYLAYGGQAHDSFSASLQYFMSDAGINIIEHIEPFFQCHRKNYWIHGGRLVFRESDHHSVYGMSIIGAAEDLAEHITDYDGVIIADYNKGVCTAETIEIVMGACVDSDIPVFVDPKFDNWLCYDGATIFKPNMKEWLQNYQTIPTVPPYKNLVITNGGKGLTVADQMDQWDKYSQHIPSRSGEVYDINGAGDSTMVAMALEYLRTDGDILRAAHVGNIAGGICVGHKYTYQVTVEDLRKAGAWDE